MIRLSYLEHCVAADDVAQLAVERHHGGARHEVRGSYPRKEAEVSEIAHDRRAGRTNDAGVQRYEDDTSHQHA